jgi:hypothetical protein
MHRRVALAISIVVAGLASLPVLTGIGSAQTTSTTYTFEECEEGWTTESNSALPVAPQWERSAPGHESEIAFRLADYIDDQNESLISPVHAVDGSPVTVSYFVTFDTEQPIDGEVFDFLNLDWSSDGETWETLKTYTGQNEGFPEFIEDSATFTPPAGTMQVRFNFISDGFFSSVTEGFAGVAVDDIEIPSERPADAVCEDTGGPDPGPSDSPDPSSSPEPSPSGDPQPNPRGCTIVGTPEGEVLRGTPDDDVICGRGGNDVIRGLGGDDVLFGDAGNDRIFGGAGNDDLRGAKGKDDLRGGKGNDEHRGGGGKDTCSDDSGKNTFRSCQKS